MMPMEPAKLVSTVRPFLVIRLLRDRDSAVRKDMEVCRPVFAPLPVTAGAAASA